MEKDLEVLMSYSGELVRWLNDTSDKLGSNTREMIGNVNSAIKNSNVFGGIGVVFSLQWRIQWNTFLDSWNAFFALLGSFKYIKNFFSNLKVKSLKTSFKNFERSVLAFNKEQDRREHTAELLVNQKETLKKFAIICQSTANEMKKAAISHVNNKIKKSIVAKKSNLLNETNAMESASENTKTKISICEFLIRLSTSIIDTYK